MANYGSYDNEQEVREAIFAGERALQSLGEARQSLKSASNWGLLDIFGGGFITGMIKHSRIDDARQALEEARLDLTRFASEVRDVRGFLVPEVNLDRWMTFADFLFDNALTDVLVQRRISDAADEVDEAIEQVETTISELRGLL